MNHDEKRIFSRLPQTRIIATKKGFKNFEANIDKLYKDETEKQFSDIAKTIYKKLKSDDPKWGWTYDSYGDFKTYFGRISSKEITTLGPSIQKCLDANENEIYKELEMLTKDCTWYNQLINQKEITTDKNIRGIKTTDCFFIITTLLSQIYKEIQAYISDFIKKISEDKITLETLNKFNDDNEIKEGLFRKIEEKFSFLTKYNLFQDVYFQMKNQSFKEATEIIRKKYSRQKLNEEYQKLRDGCALPKAKINGKYQLLRDTKSGNRTSQYIPKR